VTVDLVARPDERRVGEAIEDAARRAEGMSEEVVSVVVSVSAKESKLSARTESWVEGREGPLAGFDFLAVECDGSCRTR
jgi:hypothetical protein